jgi:hypothetical protein
MLTKVIEKKKRTIGIHIKITLKIEINLVDSLSIVRGIIQEMKQVNSATVMYKTSIGDYKLAINSMTVVLPATSTAMASRNLADLDFQNSPMKPCWSHVYVRNVTRRAELK